MTAETLMLLGGVSAFVLTLYWVRSRGLREKCIESGIGDILLYAGGNLVVGKRTFDEVERLYRDMGYDRVYPPGTMPEVAIADLQRDLNL